ncbi:MAG: type II toxin-antitoxin system VapC family toxin [Acidobacteria bacterium]|nr:type II toxin-antitoxin system VapC family toxin [Acidobacteriota bacterium]
MRLLLDTCTFIWMTSGDRELSEPVRAAVLDPDNEMFLSVVSAWELSVQYALRHVTLPEPPSQYVPKRRRSYGLQSLPLDEESALHVARLPSFHRDPFDRMLICQAIVHGLTLVTPDRLIVQYGVHTLW